MSEDVWVAHDTTPDDIEAALRDLLRKRYVANRRLAPARVLNLIVIVDRESKAEIATRLERVGRYHASRTVLCAVQEGRNTLDAVAKISYDESAGEGQPMHETVEIDLGPEQLARIDTVVDPILVAELPTMLWSPYGHMDAVDALLPMIDVILIDSDSDSDADFDFDDASAALAHALHLLNSAYVVDLAWLRTTPWRERLAASFDLPSRRAALDRLTELCVRHHPGSEASAALLSGWLASRLGWQVAALEHGGAGRKATAARQAAGDEVQITLAPVEQEAPGLAGVTVGWEAGYSLSLDRSIGGLQARERGGGGEERVWRVLGASRGEGGILGEGVRQALLRDSTYGPALDAARGLCGGTRSE